MASEEFEDVVRLVCMRLTEVAVHHEGLFLHYYQETYDGSQRLQGSLSLAPIGN
ncbi:hypothetical protein J6590_004836 [Homalodisca vitripennis]|nr:hypothetical protein J6590_004836 [Homalodisca vitripennis]